MKLNRCICCQAVVLLLVCLLLPGVAAAKGKKPITSPSTKIVRGSGVDPCNALSIGQGNSPPVARDEDLTNLSVSCSDDKTVTWKDLRKPLPHAHACGSTLGQLRKARKEVTVVSDPTKDNPYHCILDNITPAEFIKSIKWQR